MKNGISLYFLTAAVLGAFLVLIGLGSWQWQRLQWKTALISARTEALAQPAAMFPPTPTDWSIWEFRRLAVEGAFLHDEEMFWPGRLYRTGLGLDILTPLRLPDGRFLLVNRGTIPVQLRAPSARPQTLMAGLQSWEGVLRSEFRKGFFTPDANIPHREWYWYDIANMRELTGLPLLPVVLELLPQADGQALPRGKPAKVNLKNNHLQYVITWYGLALALLAVYIAFVWTQKNRKATPHDEDLPGDRTY